MSPFCRHGERFRKVKCPPKRTHAQTQVCRWLLVQGLPLPRPGHPACPLPCAPRNITEMMTTSAADRRHRANHPARRLVLPRGYGQQLMWESASEGEREFAVSSESFEIEYHRPKGGCIALFLSPLHTTFWPVVGNQDKETKKVGVQGKTL